jgi:hypothetical protein
MANQVNSKNVNNSKVTGMTQNRKQAQTSEGSIQVAAGMALNVQKNVSKAAIGDGLALTAQNLVRVRSLNDTDAIIQANAAATNSTTGVGVGAAVNVVTYENLATLGDSRVNAGSLLVEADIYEAEQKRTVEQIIADLLRYLGEMGYLDGLLDKGFDLDLEILNLLNMDPNYQSLTEQKEKARADLRKQVVDGLIAKMQSGQTKDVANQVFSGVIQSVTEKVLKKLISIDFLESLLLGTENPLNDFLDEASIVAKTTALKVKEAVLQYLASKFGSEDEMDGVGHKISTQAVSGVGAANVGVAGAAAVAVVKGTTRAVIKGTGLSYAQNGDICVTGGVTIHAQSGQKIYTTASASSDLKLNNALKNKSKSGQGGTSVGVGASSAVNVIDAAVEASLGYNRKVTAGSLNVYAFIQNDVDAVSVAGSDPIARRDEAQEQEAQLGQQPGNEAEIEKINRTNNTTTKDISVDASVALSLVQNTVLAMIAQGAVLVIQGAFGLEPDVEKHRFVGDGDYRAFELFPALFGLVRMAPLVLRKDVAERLVGFFGRGLFRGVRIRHSRLAPLQGILPRITPRLCAFLADEQRLTRSALADSTGGLAGRFFRQSRITGEPSRTRRPGGWRYSVLLSQLCLQRIYNTHSRARLHLSHAAEARFPPPRLCCQDVLMVETAEQVAAAMVWLLLAGNILVVGCAALMEFLPRNRMCRLRARARLLTRGSAFRKLLDQR